MARAPVTAQRAAAAAAFAKDKEDIAAHINKEVCALRFAFEALNLADDTRDLEGISDVRNLVSNSIRRLAQLHDALERSDMSTRRGSGAAALSTAEAAVYRNAMT
jgi:hypothetical protein